MSRFRILLNQLRTRLILGTLAFLLALMSAVALVVKLPEAKKGFVLLPRRWVAERSFGWMARFHRLARDYECLPETLAGLSFLAFAIMMAKNFVHLMAYIL